MSADLHPAEPLSVPSEPQGQRILQVRLSADLYEWLRTCAFYQRRSMNAMVNQALEQYRSQMNQP